MRAEVEPPAGKLAAVLGDAAEHDRLTRLELIRAEVHLLPLDGRRHRRRAVGRPRLHDDDRGAVVAAGGGRVFAADLHFQPHLPQAVVVAGANGRLDGGAGRGRAVAAGREQLDRRRSVREDVNLVHPRVRIALADVVEQVDRERPVAEQGDLHAQRPPVVFDRPREAVRARLHVPLAERHRRADAHLRHGELGRFEVGQLQHRRFIAAAEVGGEMKGDGKFLDRRLLAHLHRVCPRLRIADLQAVRATA